MYSWWIWGNVKLNLNKAVFHKCPCPLPIWLFAVPLLFLYSFFTEITFYTILYFSLNITSSFIKYLLNTYAHCTLLEYQNPEHWQHWRLMGMQSNRNSHSLIVGLQNGWATLKGSLALSYKSKHTLLPNHPAITLLGIYLPRGVEICPHKTLHTRL